MNRSNFEHAGYALVIQTLIAMMFGSWGFGALVAIAFFLGREHAQREYHLGDPSRLPPWAAFDFWRWPLDAQLDLLFPVVAVVGAAAIRYFI